MAIMLPHHLAEVLNFLGFPWPDIDEDELRRGADTLRRYARDAHESAKATSTRLHDVKAVTESASYTALVETWASQTRGHMDTLVDGCGLLADGLDLAAAGVETMKYAVIAQLAVALEEFLAIQAAAFATFGIAEAGLPALYAAQNKLLGAIMKTFEAEVLAALLSRTLGPLSAKIAHSVNALVFPTVAHVALGKEHGLTIDTQLLRDHAKAIGDEGVANTTAGHRLSADLNSLRLGAG